MSDEFGGEMNDAPEPVDMDSSSSGYELSDGGNDIAEEPSEETLDDNSDVDGSDGGDDIPEESSEETLDDNSDVDGSDGGDDIPEEPSEETPDDNSDVGGPEDSDETPNEPNNDVSEDNSVADGSNYEGISEGNSDIDNTDARNDDCYGHGGDDMVTYDPYASYPESHFSVTDDRYMDEHAEATDKTNERARRELEEFQRMQDEEMEAEAQRQAEMEAEQEAEAKELADAETEKSKNIEEMTNKYAELDREYQNIKKDIEMSRNKEEQGYWQRRAESIWQERDKLGGDIEDLRKK